MKKKDKSEGIFRQFWTEIIDLKSAKKAANVGAVISGILCFSYIVQLLLLYFSGEAMYISAPTSQIVFYFYIIYFLVIALFAGYVSYAILKQAKYGFIPYITVWAILEVVVKFFLAPGKGIILSLMVFFFSINAFRGWLGIRKYNKSLDSKDKKKPTWVKFLLISVAVIFFFFMLLGFLTETSLLPNTEVQRGNELSEKEKSILINNKIVDRNENILFFYSEGFFSILEGGQLITNDKIITYQRNEEQLLEIYEMYLNNVKEIVLEEKGSFFSDSIYYIIGNQNAKYTYIPIVLPMSNKKDQEFINAIKKRIK